MEQVRYSGSRTATAPDRVSLPVDASTPVWERRPSSSSIMPREMVVAIAGPSARKRREVRDGAETQGDRGRRLLSRRITRGDRLVRRRRSIMASRQGAGCCARDHALDLGSQGSGGAQPGRGRRRVSRPERAGRKTGSTRDGPPLIRRSSRQPFLSPAKTRTATRSRPYATRLAAAASAVWLRFWRSTIAPSSTLTRPQNRPIRRSGCNDQSRSFICTKESSRRRCHGCKRRST